MPRIFDNIETQLRGALQETLQHSVRLDTAVGYFNLRGWTALADSVDNLPTPGDGPKVRLLIGMADSPDKELREALRINRSQQLMSIKEADQLRTRIIQSLRNQLTLGMPTASDERTLRTLRRQLSEGSVGVKLYLRHRLHGKLYLCHRDDYSNPRTGFVGSSNLTFAGLAGQGELNVDVLDHDATQKLHEWFEERWDDTFSIDVTDDLIQLIDDSWATEELIDPYLIYLKMAYHLSREAREGLLEYGLPESMAEKLLEFQAAAVRVAARILMHRGGVMIGDVVGLGKTIIATAIARLLQEENGFETLIISPKNLTPMWEGYRDEYRIHGKVVSSSMVARELPDLKRYRLVIIDESHNLRNKKTKAWLAIRDYIQQNDSRVILLTATPYNKTYGDVAGQLGLFIDPDAQLPIEPEMAIRKLGEAEFLRRCDGNPRTLKAFEKSEEPEDWRRLMSLFLVRRTRSFIIDNYAKDDDEGRKFLTFSDGTRFYFPKRVPRPLEHAMRPDEPAALMISDSTLDAVASLRLPRYALAEYLNTGLAPTADEAEIIDALQRASGNLSGVTRIMLFKRLSSSGPAFLLSLRRHLLRNWLFVNALRNGDPLPIGSISNAVWNEDDDEGQDSVIEDRLAAATPDWSHEAAAAYALILGAKSKTLSWIRSEHFDDVLRLDLEHDIAVIEQLLRNFGEWDHTTDSKLDALDNLIRRSGNKKVLVFSEYRDTAEYVADALEQRGIQSIASVSGSSDDPTMLARRFSPRSNREIGGLPKHQTELRTLIATDVLSEGQNLQDAHIVVNYDLPWAIIKIIQRAGRVDRIGQQSREVEVHSFLPDNDIEKQIDLRSRIRRRLGEAAAVFGSDEMFFGDEKERSLIEGLYDERSQELNLQESDQDVDWASMAYEIWRRATENDPGLLSQVENLSGASYATKSAQAMETTGVIVYTQTDLGFDGLAFTGEEGASKLLSPSEALQLAECELDTPALEPLENHHDLVALAVTGPLLSPAAHLEGALTGVRKRCWDRLRTYKERYAGSLFDSPLLDLALDQIYRKPLRESATQTLSKALQERTPEELAELLVTLHQDGRLCVEESEIDDDDIRIICSLGIRGEA